MKNWKMLVVGAVASLALIVAGCGSEAPNKEEAKVIKVGTHATYPPFEFTKENSNEIQGFDYDFMNEIGKRMGYKVEWTNMAFDGLVPALQSGQLDAAIAGINITDARKQVVDFSQTYYTTYSVAMVLKNSPIQTPQQLENQPIGTELATGESDYARTIPGAKVSDFNNIPDALNAMKTGAVHAVLVDSPPAIYYAQKDPGAFHIFPLNTEETPVGIAISKKQAHLVGPINEAIESMKKDGTYQKLVDKWFSVQ